MKAFRDRNRPVARAGILRRVPPNGVAADSPPSHSLGPLASFARLAAERPTVGLTELLIMSKLTLSFGTPEHGWLNVNLRCGEAERTLDVSDVPGDSLAMLANGVLQLVKGHAAEVTITWFLEPAEEIWTIRRFGDAFLLDCRHRLLRVPFSPASPGTRDPPDDLETVLRLADRRVMARGDGARARRRSGVVLLSGEGGKSGQA